MSRTNNRVIGTLAAALVVAALVPGASIAYQDLRSPDARDAAQVSKTTQTTQSQDLRSPDARDAALASQTRSYQDLRSPDARDAGIAAQAREYQDLRSPDARDATVVAQAQGYQDLRSPDARDIGRVPSTPSPTPAPTDNGTAWDEIGIVAGGVLLLMGLGTFAVVGRRRLATRKARAAVVSG
jgi:hypothetical protein